MFNSIEVKSISVYFNRIFQTFCLMA